MLVAMMLMVVMVVMVIVIMVIMAVVVVAVVVWLRGFTAIVMCCPGRFLLNDLVYRLHTAFSYVVTELWWMGW